MVAGSVSSWGPDTRLGSVMLGLGREMRLGQDLARPLVLGRVRQFERLVSFTDACKWPMAYTCDNSEVTVHPARPDGVPNPDAARHRAGGRAYQHTAYCILFSLSRFTISFFTSCFSASRQRGRARPRVGAECTASGSPVAPNSPACSLPMLILTLRHRVRAQTSQCALAATHSRWRERGERVMCSSRRDLTLS